MKSQSSIVLSYIQLKIKKKVQLLNTRIERLSKKCGKFFQNKAPAFI